MNIFDTVPIKIEDEYAYEPPLTLKRKNKKSQKN